MRKKTSSGTSTGFLAGIVAGSIFGPSMMSAIAQEAFNDGANKAKIKKREIPCGYHNAKNRNELRLLYSKKTSIEEMNALLKDLDEILQKHKCVSRILLTQ